MFLSMLLMVVCIFVTGCFKGSGLNYTQGVSIDNYDPALSEFDTANYNLPEDFLDTCGYTDGKFYLDTEMNEDYLYLLEKLDRTLMWLSFKEAEYELAKSSILNRVKPYIQEEKVYNEYHFMIYGYNFPDRCRMTCYNDEKDILIFMVIYCESWKYPDIEYGTTDFGLYLKTFFGDFYDFDA